MGETKLHGQPLGLLDTVTRFVGAYLGGTGILESMSDPLLTHTLAIPA